MLPICLPHRSGVCRVLALGAHPDDIEIGCGGTLLRLVAHDQPLEVWWIVFTGHGARADEARASAEAFLGGATARRVEIQGFRDGFLPWSGSEVKDAFETLKHEVDPDIIFTHRRDDAHQDHRMVGELTWNTFRDHLIFEYEIPKYEGDLGAPNVFMPLDAATADRKVELLLKHFPTQQGRGWFDGDTFWSVLRLRGLESNAPSRFAEGFYVRKLVLA